MTATPDTALPDREDLDDEPTTSTPATPEANPTGAPEVTPAVPSAADGTDDAIAGRVPPALAGPAYWRAAIAAGVPATGLAAMIVGANWGLPGALATVGTAVAGAGVAYVMRRRRISSTARAAREKAARATGTGGNQPAKRPSDGGIAGAVRRLAGRRDRVAGSSAAGAGHGTRGAGAGRRPGLARRAAAAVGAAGRAAKQVGRAARGVAAARRARRDSGVGAQRRAANRVARQAAAAQRRHPASVRNHTGPNPARRRGRHTAGHSPNRHTAGVRGGGGGRNNPNRPRRKAPTRGRTSLPHIPRIPWRYVRRGAAATGFGLAGAAIAPSVLGLLGTLGVGAGGALAAYTTYAGTRWAVTHPRVRYGSRLIAGWALLQARRLRRWLRYLRQRRVGVEGELMPLPRRAAPPPPRPTPEVWTVGWSEPTPWTPPTATAGDRVQPQLVVVVANATPPTLLTATTTTPPALPHRQQPQLVAGSATPAAAPAKKEPSMSMQHVVESIVNSDQFVPDSGHDAQDHIEGYAQVMQALAAKAGGDMASIAATLPQHTESLQHLAAFPDALASLAGQIHELVDAWRQSAAWVWNGQR